ncbi:MAG TPA: YdjY domain-containing protein [Pirellulaceae bacterium]|nr:YdjY domain-containing protein [Pirellulaceae bacterium]
MRPTCCRLPWTVLLLLAGGLAFVFGQESAREKPPAVPAAVSQVPPPPPATWQRLSRQHDVWLDAKNKLVIVDGEICLREGQLELFACPTGTKEHEAVVSLNCIPEQVHAGLLALGARQGKPVSFDPAYRAATGDVIDIYVTWTDEAGKQQTARAQQWVKYAKTGKEMPFDWVFAGSGFWTDEETGKKHYQANAGDLICVSNFPTATLDLPVESTQANAGLLFVAFTEKIPPRGTKVRVVLTPRVKREVKETATEERKPAP